MTASNAIIDRLDRLLDEERAILRSGRLEALADLLARKEAIVARLASAGAAVATNGELRCKIVRNQRLLEGALSGLGEVESRLEQVRESRRTLETYGSDGRRAAIGASGGGRMERRA
jgi:flagellar biosynthesis/type III secretory pathway chaperone